MDVVKDLLDTHPPATARTSYEELPGEAVLRYAHSDNTDGNKYGFEFTVRKLTAGKHFPRDNEENAKQRDIVFEAATPYRNCVYQGDTPQQAIGNMLLGMCLLTRDGSINPHCPELKGSPVIQHVMEILSEHLAQTLQHRRRHLNDNGAYGPQTNDSLDDRKRATGNVAWHNEIIAAVGTAISALARVKDL